VPAGPRLIAPRDLPGGTQVEAAAVSARNWLATPRTDVLAGNERQIDKFGYTYDGQPDDQR
jgi:hypothetical protein